MYKYASVDWKQHQDISIINNPPTVKKIKTRELRQIFRIQIVWPTLVHNKHL